MYKNQLQELAQRSCFNFLCYTCVREGPDHAPRFKASVNFNGETFQSSFYSNTIRQAEHTAAQAALASLSSRCPSKSLTARVLDETGIYKNLLQETAHRAGMNLPTYTTLRSGPGHVPIFTSTVYIGGISFKGNSAKTKKQAEKNAAIAAWSALKTMPNVASSSQSSKEIKTQEELDQAIVTSVLSNLCPRDEIKLIKMGDLNQVKGSMYIARGDRDTGFTTQTKPLPSSVLKVPPRNPIPNSFPSLLSPPLTKRVSKLPSVTVGTAGKPTVKIQSPLLDEHRRDEDEWLVGKLKAETTTATLIEKNISNLRVSEFSGYGPIKLLDHWIYGEESHRGYNPREWRSVAPAVQVRSIIPVCTAPPLLRCAPTASSHSPP